MAVRLSAYPITLEEWLRREKTVAASSSGTICRIFLREISTPAWWTSLQRSF